MICEHYESDLERVDIYVDKALWEEYKDPTAIVIAGTAAVYYFSVTGQQDRHSTIRIVDIESREVLESHTFPDVLGEFEMMWL